MLEGVRDGGVRRRESGGVTNLTLVLTDHLFDAVIVMMTTTCLLDYELSPDKCFWGISEHLLSTGNGKGRKGGLGDGVRVGERAC